MSKDVRLFTDFGSGIGVTAGRVLPSFSLPLGPVETTVSPDAGSGPGPGPAQSSATPAAVW
ncbi:hypothetical protein, partial [Cohnella sp. GbtcB17]|uniref:hypothetical protein n=1 Tax=Cohnella sp. GbtcB17 TaxID=2824762 RepID=UPI001C30B64A